MTTDHDDLPEPSSDDTVGSWLRGAAGPGPEIAGARLALEPRIRRARRRRTAMRVTGGAAGVVGAVALVLALRGPSDQTTPFDTAERPASRVTSRVETTSTTVSVVAPDPEPSSTSTTSTGPSPTTAEPATTNSSSLASTKLSASTKPSGSTKPSASTVVTGSSSTSPPKTVPPAGSTSTSARATTTTDRGSVTSGTERVTSSSGSSTTIRSTSTTADVGAQTFTSAGGSLTIKRSADGESLELVNVQAAAGYTAQAEKVESDEIRYRFIAGNVEHRIELKIDDGNLQTKIT